MKPGMTAKYFSGTNTFLAGLTETIFRFRWVLLLLVAVLTIFAFYEMRSIRMDSSNEVWFIESDQTLKLLDKFRDVFGNDDFVVLLVESDNFFEPENIRALGRLAKVLETEVPYLKDITWLGNVESMLRAPGTALTFMSFWKTYQKTRKKRLGWR